jgi:hypothetical protein
MRGSRGPRQLGGGKQTGGPRHRDGGRPFRPHGPGGKRPSKGGGPGRTPFGEAARDGAAPQHRKASFRHPEATAKRPAKGGRPGRASLEARSRRAPQVDAEREGAAPQHRKDSFRRSEVRAKARPEGRWPERVDRDSFEVRPERSGEARERPYDRPRQDDGERKRAAPQHRKASSRQARVKARSAGRGERANRDSFEARPARSEETRERRYDRRSHGQREGAAPEHRKPSFRHPEAAAKRPSKGDGQPSRRSPTWLSSKQSKSDKPISVGRASFEARTAG